jgi:LysR family glycine cleavage system transcriptional activator
MLPPLNALRAFEAVARHKSFTRAAGELSVSQSAVSHQVRGLESALNLRLLSREGRAVELTREGRLLFADLSDSLARIRRALANLEAVRRATPLGVSVRPHFAMKWLAPRLSRFWQRHPGFDLRFYHTNELADFTDAQLHVAVEWRHLSEVSADARLLVPGNLTPACGPALLAGGNRPRKPEDLRRHALLHESDERSWLEWLAAAGVPGLQPARQAFYEDTNVRQQAAKEGEGFALVCPELVADEVAAGQLVCPFDIRLETFSYYLLAPPDRLDIPNVRKFVAWLANEAQPGAKEYENIS